ncbi:MAG: phosphatidate cytidylyltransferase [Oscillospiraceae bacterium]|nr:phosphatidate cytidylyltransferase [Oscillospiraceae bacterium]
MKKRVISAVVMLAVTFICVLLSEVSRVVFFGIIGLVCAYEWCKNLRVREVHCADWVLYYLFAALTVVTVLHGGAFWYAAVLVSAVMLSMAAGVIQQRVSGFGAMFTAAGVAYLGILFAAIFAVSVSKIWLQTFALGCISTWVCDSCALFGGSRFGKHKLAPKVSPKKTWEGSLCGAASAVIVGVILCLLPWYKGAAWWLIILAALVASSLGQIGDLAESLFKRMIGVKDSSNLIPGHGGALDRVDSLLFAIPTAYFFLRIAGLGV